MSLQILPGIFPCQSFVLYIDHRLLYFIDPSCQWISGYYSYGGTTPDQNSEFAIQKGTYLRLKTAEIDVYKRQLQYRLFILQENGDCFGTILPELYMQIIMQV